MLKKVHFEGIKSLLDVTVELEPFTVLVGPNGCGKSTLLDQIELITMATKADLGSQNVFGPAGEALKAADIGELRTSGKELAIVFSALDGNDCQMSITVAPGIAIQWYAGTILEATTADGTKHLSYQEAMASRQAFDEHLAKGFTWKAQRLAMNPKSIVYPSPVDVNALAPDGYGLPTILKDLAGNDTGAFLQLQEDLRKVVPQFRELKFGKATQDKRPMVTLELVMQQGRIPAHRASDGTLLALALLTATHNPDMPNLILMDDIDHGLHLSAQYQIIEAIRRVMAVRPDLQVICTTHSPILLDSFKPDEVRVMALDKDGHTQVKPLTAMPDFARQKRGLQTGELWASMGEDWVAEASTDGG